MQPPASLKALGDPIYEAFYGLTEQPFAITTDPRFFYLSASHQRAFSELLNGLRRRESLLLLTGETGTGKTTLCRAVLAALGDRTFSAIILNPYMTGAEVLRIVLRDFGLVSHEELRRGGLATADVPQLLDTLEGFLQSLIPLGGHAVIVLDEAQSLAPAVLDQIRVLTGLEHQGKRLLQVVLCGQPNLLETIKTESLRALNERITRRVELIALPANDIDGYIQHRLGVAGGTDSVRFDTAASQTVADLSRGLPRRVNVLCDRALQEGRIEGVNVITSALVKRAARAVAGVYEPVSALRAPSEPSRPAHDPVPVIPAVTRPAAAPSAPALVAAAVDRASVDEIPSSATAAIPEPSVQNEVPSAEPAMPAAAIAPAEAGPTHVSTLPPTPQDSPAESPEPGPWMLLDAPDAAPVRPSAPALSVAMPAATPAAPDAITATMARPSETTASAIDLAPRQSQREDPPQEFPTEHAGTAGPAQDGDSTDSASVTRELSFGLEKSNSPRPLRMAALVLAILIVIAGLGYAAWAWPTRDSGGLITTQPPRAFIVSPGTPATPVPVPSEDEIRALAPPVRRTPSSAPVLVETPDDVVPLPEPAQQGPAGNAPVN